MVLKAPLEEISEQIGPAKEHHVAEYRALISGLEAARSRGIALRAQSAISMGLVDVPTLVAASEQRLELARETGDLSHAAGALSSLATAAHYNGDSARAKQLYEESLRLARQTGNPLRVSDTLANLAGVLRAEGDLAQARTLYRRTWPSAG